MRANQGVSSLSAALLVFGGLFCVGATARAADKACLLEGSVTIGKQTIEIKDCLQNDGVPEDRFKETCSSIAQAGESVGGKAAKVTYMGACPVPSQGRCNGFFGQPMSSHYYKRDAKTLAITEKSCKTQGGKWN